jgi:carboxyl-terminal processing protease
MEKRHLVSSVVLGALVAVLLWSATGNPRTFASTDHRELDLITNVLNLIKTNYVEEVDQQKLVEGAVRGMLATLDPHTSYLSEDLYREMQLDTRGEFEGLGIEISKRNGFVTIVSPIDGTPAARAGLKALDQITAVCPDSADEGTCQSTQEMELFDAVKLMRGPRGTEIMIRIMREGWEMPRPFVIKREAIKVSPVTMFPVDDSVVYLRLSQFTESAETDMRKELARARKVLGKEIAGLVLDMRDNPGGLLEQAVKVSDLFLEEGVIVSSEGRDGSGRMEWSASSEITEPEYPIVVLVNGGSASASEIVAGALQDRKRAFVVGTETFGKGSVQTIIPLNGVSGGKAGLRLTTQLYYLPSGRSIQEVRVQPDLMVEPFTPEMIEALDKAAAEKKTFGEIDLEGHLRNRSAVERATPPKPAPAEEPKKPGTEEPVTKESEFKRQLQVDRQLMQAVALLKSAPIFSKRLYVADPTTP